MRNFDQRSEKFKRSDRHWKSLSAILKEAIRWKRVEIFKLMVSEDEALRGDSDGEVFSSNLEQVVEEAGASNLIQIEWDVLDRNVSTERHPRYLLGMASGLHFDWGFDTGEVNTTNHIEWMGRSVLEPLLRNFT